jgi:hypothetical protein
MVDDPRLLQIRSADDIFRVLKDKGRGLASFKKGNTIQVWNRMKKGYAYRLDEAPGQGFAPEFKPWADPGEMLALGVFEGKYLNDCLLEFPAEWFLRAAALDKLHPSDHTKEINLFKADSRLTLQEWKRKGWLPGGAKKTGILADPDQNPDERGWFQWYCRYWMGRRIPALDAEQIRRWKAFSRHDAQVRKNCKKGDAECRPRQRQALLQWAWNPFV